MKRILYIIMYMTALLAGCTDEMDTMQGEMKKVTLTLATDSQYVNETTPMAKTRAAVTMNRYVMEIYTDEACTKKANLFDGGTTHHMQQATADFSLTLDRSKTYYCLFWADENAQDCYDVSNLQNVKFLLATSRQPSVAYTGKATIDNSSATLTVTLKRAVAQVVLNEKDNLQADKVLTLKYSQPDGFIVAEGRATGNQPVEIKVTAASATASGGEITRFYMLAPQKSKTWCELKFASGGLDGSAGVIPLQANYTTNVTGHYILEPDQMKFTIDLTSFTDKSYTLPFGYTTMDNYTLTVDWGDGTDVLTLAPYASTNGLLTHTYTEQKAYQITISSTQTDATLKQMPNFNNDNSDAKKIKSMDTPMLNTGSTSLIGCFYECSNLETISVGLFDKNTKVEDFTNCFWSCTKLTAIPSGLFDKNTVAKTFAGCFYSCEALEMIPSGLFNNNRNVTNFSRCFIDCRKLQAIPSGLFNNNRKVTDFSNCFNACYILKTIPSGLFDNNASVTTFHSCFFNCEELTTIPLGLFDKNTKVTTFGWCFRKCGKLDAIPEKLFEKNVLATDFSLCFHSCTKATLNANIFCDENAKKATRFANTSKAINFSYCFYDCSGSGMVPTLWSYTYSKPPTKTACFGGVTNVTNKDEIDSEWK